MLAGEQFSVSFLGPSQHNSAQKSLGNACGPTSSTASLWRTWLSPAPRGGNGIWVPSPYLTSSWLADGSLEGGREGQPLPDWARPGKMHSIGTGSLQTSTKTLPFQAEFQLPWDKYLPPLASQIETFEHLQRRTATANGEGGIRPGASVSWRAGAVPKGTGTWSSVTPICSP